MIVLFQGARIVSQVPSRSSFGVYHTFIQFVASDDVMLRYCPVIPMASWMALPQSKKKGVPMVLQLMDVDGSCGLSCGQFASFGYLTGGFGVSEWKLEQKLSLRYCRCYLHAELCETPKVSRIIKQLFKKIPVLFGKNICLPENSHGHPNSHIGNEIYIIFQTIIFLLSIFNARFRGRIYSDSDFCWRDC